MPFIWDPAQRREGVDAYRRSTVQLPTTSE